MTSTAERRGFEVVADKAALDWPMIERMSERFGQADCLISNTIALVVLRLRESNGDPLDQAPTPIEINGAIDFIDWKQRLIREWEPPNG